MLISIYLASLVFGGILLGASILLGGDGDTDADGDFDGDLSADLDGVDFDSDLDVDGGFDKSFGKDIDAAGTRSFLWPLRTVRFWTFFAAFFGMAGLAAQGLGLLPPIPALIFALLAGIGSGSFASWAIRRIAADDSGRAAEATDYLGKSAKVLVPVQPGGVGKVRVQVRGQTVDVLATTDDDEAISPGDDVLVIEMDGPRARISRLTKD